MATVLLTIINWTTSNLSPKPHYYFVFLQPLFSLTLIGNLSERGYWASPTEVNLALRLPTVLGWIEDCEKSHPGYVAPKVEQTRFQLPRRMLHVGGTRNVDLIPVLQIDTFEDNFDQSTKYIALSHCWGK